MNDRRSEPAPAAGRVLSGELDGNAIGGLLLEVFGAEMTTAVGTCAACAASGPLAETVVYLHAPGAIVRCRNCQALLIAIVSVRAMNCVDLSGLAALEVR